MSDREIQQDGPEGREREPRASTREEAPADGTLCQEDLAGLEPLLAPLLEPRHYPAGRVLWTEGERSGRLTVIDRGRVKVTRARADGTALLLYVFGPGTVIGFLPLLDGGPYPATAVAVEDVEARVVSRTALRDAVGRQPELAWALLEVLGRRLRQAFDQVEHRSQREARARLASALLGLLPPVVPPPPVVLALPGPAYQFAEEIGLSPETLSRVTAELEDRGILRRLERGRYQVLDLDGLRHLSNPV